MERVALRKKESRLRILISGASGFVGAPLKQYLSSKGHTVLSLSRASGKERVFWDPENRLIPTEFLEGFDAVIHLAGEALSFGRWSAKKKEKIARSRVEGTSFLVDALSSLKSPPKHFLSASAVGFYGDRGEEFLDEESPPGSHFLSSVCKRWEKATDPLKGIGTRVVHLRFGVVLGDGGLLKRLKVFYKCGLGATLGSGKQWMSWIGLEDLILGVHSLLDSDVEGPVNLCSPNPIRQETFSRELAKSLKRPHILKIPKGVLRLLLGTMTQEMILSSQRVTPSVLSHLCFTYKSPKIEDILYRKPIK